MGEWFPLSLTYNTKWLLDELESPQCALVARATARRPKSRPELHGEPDDDYDLHAKQYVHSILLVFLDGGEHAQCETCEHHQKTVTNKRNITKNVT